MLFELFSNFFDAGTADFRSGRSKYSLNIAFPFHFSGLRNQEGIQDAWMPSFLSLKMKKRDGFPLAFS
jgi:hypothetical protein